MQLTLQTDYALRALIYVGLHRKNATISEIADRFSISRNHLVKVVHRLGLLGYLHTTRGRSGGVRLAKEPREISIGSVVRDIEPGFDLVECFSPERNRCPITPSCKLKHVLVDAKDAFMATLDQYTLEDVLVNESSLRSDLGLEATVELRP